MVRFVRNNQTLLFAGMALLAMIENIGLLYKTHTLSVATFLAMVLLLAAFFFIKLLFDTKKCRFIIMAGMLVAGACASYYLGISPSQNLDDAFYFALPLVILPVSTFGILCFILCGIITKRPKDELKNFAAVTFLAVSLITCLATGETLVISMAEQKTPLLFITMNMAIISLFFLRVKTKSVTQKRSKS
jgi:peptidoglycan/LPS O-acetylase OafA/YrhL